MNNQLNIQLLEKCASLERQNRFLKCVLKEILDEENKTPFVQRNQTNTIVKNMCENTLVILEALEAKDK